MGIPGSANPMLLAGAAGAYQINQSLRFNSADSTNLTRNIFTTGNRRTFTISFWFKSVVSNSEGGFVATDGNILASNYIEFELTSSNKLQFRYSTGNARSTTAVFRDPSAWYHIVFAVDTTQATDTNRIRVYVNGIEYATTGDAYPAQNFDTNFNTAGVAAQIGHSRDNSGNPAKYLSGYIAEYNHIDGQQLTPSSFGETDTITGAWIPKKYSGSYGTNGFYLKFDPSATNGIGHDHSGNGNNWTASGFSTSGTGTDVMSDTPTTNYATWNPINKGPGGAGSYGSQLSDGNLVLAYNRTVGDFYATSTFSLPTTGKWYWEQRLTSAGSVFAVMGIAELNWTWNVSPRVSYLSNGKIWNSPDGSSDAQTGLSTYTTGDVIGHAWDADAGTLQFYKNGTAVGNPQAPTTTSGITFAITFNAGSDTGWTTVLNCGQRAFEQTPPTGYKALNTANLPEPTIKKGSKYMDVLTWSGTGGGSGATRSLTGLGFSPDFVWGKIRTSSSPGHILMDSVRGVGTGKYLQSNTTNAEGTSGPNEALYGYLSSLDSAGFTVTNGTSTFDNWNKSGDTYVAWGWDAGGAGSSNTAGTITSTVSANASAGFSIATYTGNGTAGATVGHGLGVAPKMIMVKRRDTGADWAVYHASTGATKYLTLNNTNSAGTSSAYWNNTEPTSTLFSLGLSGEANTNGGTFVAYCFSEVAGYSKFGSYTGNGSTDGTFVYCGFRPRWILVKRTDSTGTWEMYDTARDTYNVMSADLAANLSDAEVSQTRFDALSNGFKNRITGAASNASGGTYIFAAFSETAFKFANAR